MHVIVALYILYKDYKSKSGGAHSFSQLVCALREAKGMIKYME